MAITPTPKPAHAPAKPHPATIDELANALRALVTLAETAGQRDHPEVGQAQEVLAKHDASAKPVRD